MFGLLICTLSLLSLAPDSTEPGEPTPVELRLFDETGAPLDPDHVLEVLLLADQCASELDFIATGRYRGQLDADVHEDTEIKVRVLGKGLTGEWLEPKRSNHEQTILLEASVPTLPNSATVRYWDLIEGEHANQTLTLMVMQSEEHQAFVPRTIRTDADGFGRLEAVQFPCYFYFPSSDVSVAHSPTLTGPARLDGTRIVEITRKKSRRVQLRLPRALGDSTTNGLPLLDLRPRTASSSLGYVPCLGYGKVVKRDALRAVSEGKALELGPLTPGSYRATFYHPGAGALSCDVRVDRHRHVAASLLYEAGSPLNLQLVGPTRLIDRAMIFDGEVPHTLLPALRSHFDWTAVPAHAESDARGSAVLDRHNRHQTRLTVVTRDGGLWHVDKPGPDGIVELRADPNEGALAIRVVNEQGRPLSGLVVNLTTPLESTPGNPIRTPRTSELDERRTDVRGRVLIAGVRPGRYVLSVARLSVSPNGRKFEYDPHGLRFVTVTSGRRAVQITFHPEAARHVCEPTCDHPSNETTSSLSAPSSEGR